MTALAGVYCALATPLDAGGSIDVGGLERVLDRVVRGGAAGVCPAGSTGEGMRLSAEQRVQLVRRARAFVPAGTAVIPSPLATDPRATAEEVRVFAGEGADAVLVPPPASYRLADDDVLGFYETLADASPVPMVLYHIPDLMGVGIAAEVAARLAGHPRIIGIKDSSRQFEYSQQVIYATRDASGGFGVLTGSDTMLMATMLHGGVGAIAASANLVPDLGVALYRACIERDWDEAGRVQEQLFQVVSAVRRTGFAAAGWKAALEQAGVCSAYPAPPAGPLPGPVRDRLGARLRDLGVLEGSLAAEGG